MQENATRILRRIARVWSSVIVVFGVLMFVMEITEAFTIQLEPYPFYENIIPLTLFTGIVGLALAWRWEGAGGMITVASVILNFVVYVITGREAVIAVVIILAPLLIPGFLFLVCWLRSQKLRRLTI